MRPLVPVTGTKLVAFVVATGAPLQDVRRLTITFAGVTGPDGRPDAVMFKYETCVTPELGVVVTFSLTGGTLLIFARSSCTRPLRSVQANWKVRKAAVPSVTA